MSQYLEAFEQMMVSMETPSRPMHAGGLEILQIPAGAPPDFVAKLVKGLRAVKPHDPFNKALAGTGWNRWKPVPVNMNYHLRYVSLPQPGSIEQLMQMTEALYGPPLNRSLALWECWVIDGLHGNRVAIAFKAHHALSDGSKGMTTYLSSLSVGGKSKFADPPGREVRRVGAEAPAARIPACARTGRHHDGLGRTGALAPEGQAITPEWLAGDFRAPFWRVSSIARIDQSRRRTARCDGQRRARRAGRPCQQSLPR
jgi:hypothetical protein